LPAGKRKPPLKWQISGAPHEKPRRARRKLQRSKVRGPAAQVKELPITINQ